MTELDAQNAMLERLLVRHQLWRDDECKRALAFGSELLLAVQERDARLADKMQFAAGNVLAKGHDTDAAAQHDTAMEIAEAIRAQTYADLFLKEE